MSDVWPIGVGAVPRLTVTHRLRARLKQLMKRGDAASLARYSQTSPGGSKILPQNISYFLNDKTGRIGLDLNDLDDLAAFFSTSIGELVGETKLGNLEGDEQRIVYAYRALPTAVQEHFLAVIELASLAPRQSAQQYLRRKDTSATTKAPADTATASSPSHSLPQGADNAHPVVLAADVQLDQALTEFLSLVSDAARALRATAARARADQQTPNSVSEETARRDLGD